MLLLDGVRHSRFTVQHLVGLPKASSGPLTSVPAFQPHSEPASANTAPFKPTSLGRNQNGICSSTEAPQYIVPPRASLDVPNVRSRGPSPAGAKPRTRFGPSWN